MKNIFAWLFIITIVLSACQNPDDPPIPPLSPYPISSCDLSFLPEIRQSGTKVKNFIGEEEDMLTTLQKSGMNTVRLRLWYNPIDGFSGLEAVKQFSDEIKSKGMKVWLTVHYSDSWADPGNQTKPVKWNSLTYNQLKDSVFIYTKRIVTEIQPEFIQIGNEINHGLLWPEGNISNPTQMVELLKQGVKAVRENSTQTKIMIHFAGFEDAIWFYDVIKQLDYDIIALSYYPLWHGKNLDSLESKLLELGNRYDKDIVIAETSYPFTFSWNDYTNNIIGSQDQILAEFPATPEGQRDYMLRLTEIILSSPKGVGFSYWGGEWIAFKGNTASNGSSWENQALWDFNNSALPAINALHNIPISK